MTVNDPFADYETAMQRLLEDLGQQHPQYTEALTYQQRLSENIGFARLHGDTETRRAERAEIIDQINRLAIAEGSQPIAVHGEGLTTPIGRSAIRRKYWVYSLGVLSIILITAVWLVTRSYGSGTETSAARVPNDIKVIAVNSPEEVPPGESFWPEIIIQPQGGDLREDRGDMLRHVGGPNPSGFPHITVKGTVTQDMEYVFTFYEDHPMRAPQAEGSYESIWCVWAGGACVGPRIRIPFTVVRNERPAAPLLIAPGDWAEFRHDLDPIPGFCAKEQGDPDGDPIVAYQFSLEGSQQRTSGWVTSDCITWADLEVGSYEWRAQVKDARGAVSGQSEPYRFTVRSTMVTITDMTLSPPSPAAADTVVIYAATDGCGGMGIDLKVFANTANDGSDRGTWEYVNGLGVPKFNEADAPRWFTLDWEDGPHLVRLEVTTCTNEKVIQDQVYVLEPRPPGHATALEPADAAWVNRPAVTLRWNAPLRAETYTLQVAPTQALLDTTPSYTVPVSETQYPVTLDPAVPQYVWRIIAQNALGATPSAIWTINLDVQPPSTTIDTSRTPTTIAQSDIPLFWMGNDDRSGIQSYDVQVQRAGETTWTDWLTGTSATNGVFPGQPGTTTCFRVRATDVAGNVEVYPTTSDTCVTTKP